MDSKLNYKYNGTWTVVRFIITKKTLDLDLEQSLDIMQEEF